MTVIRNRVWWQEYEGCSGICCLQCLYGYLGVSKLYNLISLLAAAGIEAVAYGVLCYVFKVEEVSNIVHKVRDGLGWMGWFMSKF